MLELSPAPIHLESSTASQPLQQNNGCMAAGCSNTLSNRVSLLKLPSNGVLRRIWEKQEQRILAQWKATKHSPIFVVIILLRTYFKGVGLPWWPGMKGREVVFLEPAARWWPVAGRSRTGW